ncbi:hypothetical protein, partial [Prauserella flavalba]|uniref:hypothetical protein n=1 Tax=Prauserella flavalba TaxID=1477506 RepID=UPI0036E0243E
MTGGTVFSGVLTGKSAHRNRTPAPEAFPEPPDRPRRKALEEKGSPAARESAVKATFTALNAVKVA